MFLHVYEQHFRVPGTALDSQITHYISGGALQSFFANVVMPQVICKLDLFYSHAVRLKSPWCHQMYVRLSRCGSNWRNILLLVYTLCTFQWVPRKIHTQNGPKTINQVRHEAAKEFGLNIPTPPSPSATMMPPANMDLFGRPLNNGTSK